MVQKTGTVTLQKKNAEYVYIGCLLRLTYGDIVGEHLGSFVGEKDHPCVRDNAHTV